MKVCDLQLDKRELFGLIREAVYNQLTTWDAFRDIEWLCRSEFELRPFIENLAIGGPLLPRDCDDVVGRFYERFGNEELTDDAVENPG